MFPASTQNDGLPKVLSITEFINVIVTKEAKMIAQMFIYFRGISEE